MRYGEFVHWDVLMLIRQSYPARHKQLCVMDLTAAIMKSTVYNIHILVIDTGLLSQQIANCIIIFIYDNGKFESRAIRFAVLFYRSFWVELSCA